MTALLIPFIPSDLRKVRFFVKCDIQWLDSVILILNACKIEIVHFVIVEENEIHYGLIASWYAVRVYSFFSNGVCCHMEFIVFVQLLINFNSVPS